MCTVTIAFTGQSGDLHIMAGIFSLDNLSLPEKTPSLDWGILVNFLDILSETSKAVQSGIWVGIPTYHGCPVTVSICPSG